jgi:hypothetical protein
MTNRLSLSALFLGACSGAHLPPVPAPGSVPSSGSSSAHRPWVCATPVGALELPLPESHGLPLVGVSVAVQVGPQRITVACEAPRVVEAPSAAPSAPASDAGATPSVPESVP